MNDQIRRNPIRLIDEQEQMVGVIDTAEALDSARELGLDLVEVAPDADPPVCRILDYGKFRYEQSKKERANKKNSKTAELKSIRLGRSLKLAKTTSRFEFVKPRSSCSWVTKCKLCNGSVDVRSH